MAHLPFGDFIAVSYETKQGPRVGLMDNDEIVRGIRYNELTI